MECSHTFWTYSIVNEFYIFVLFGVFVHPVSLLLIYFSLASFIISLRLLLKISVNLRSTQKKPSHYHATYPNHSHSKLGCSGLLLSSLLTPALFIMYYCNRNILCRVKRKYMEFNPIQTDITDRPMGLGGVKIYRLLIPRLYWMTSLLT